MTSTPRNPEHEDHDASALVSATLYLLSSFSASGCPRVAIMIRHHLQLLAAHPDADPMVRSTSVQLIDKYWARAEADAHRLLESGQNSASASAAVRPDSVH